MPPAQTITATLIRDETAYPFIDFETGRKVAERVYRVNTDDTDLARTAPGVPGLGDAWGPDHTDLLVTSIKPRHETGGDVDADFVGWSRVRVSYVSAGGQPEVLAAENGDAFTSVVPGLRQVPVRFDVNGGPIPETTIDVEATELIVSAYRSDLSWITAWRAIASPTPAVNQNTLVLPAVFQVATALMPVNAGQLLARTYDIEMVREGLLRVRYRFGFAGDWLFRYRDEDENGMPIGAVKEAQVYRSAFFDDLALWGGP